MTATLLRPAQVDDRPPIQLAAAAAAVRALLLALGQDPSDEHLDGTPTRVAKSLAAMLTPEPFELTTFANNEGYRELVLVRDIPFHSLCAHHLLPFHGVAHVCYVPGERIVGLSKLARVVDHFARALQVQERLTTQVADCLELSLAADGVGIVIEADHQCMSLRGAQAHGARTVTSALRGQLRDDAGRRAEFLGLIHGR